ncbi:hypothetical protein ACWC3Y_10945 [Streptomyces sp. NPDC001296]
MPERTDQPQAQPTPASPALQPSRILAEPATAALCQQDYVDGAGVRARMDQQDARAHR